MTKHFHISSFNSSLRPCLLTFFASAPHRLSTQWHVEAPRSYNSIKMQDSCFQWKERWRQKRLTNDLRVKSQNVDKNIKESHKFAGTVLLVKTGARTIRRCTLHFIHFPPAACGFLGGNGKYDLLTVRWSVVRERREKSRLREGAHLDVVQLFLSALRAGLLRSVQEYSDRLMLNRM